MKKAIRHRNHCLKSLRLNQNTRLQKYKNFGNEHISAQCWISYRNQSFDLNCVINWRHIYRRTEGTYTFLDVTRMPTVFFTCTSRFWNALPTLFFCISIKLISILIRRCLKKLAHTKHIFQSQIFLIASISSQIKCTE